MEDEIEKHVAAINQIRSDHRDEIQDIDRRWKTVIKDKSSQLENKHEHEVAELTHEWQNERKVCL